MRNNINLFVTISHKIRLRILEEYKQDKYFLIEAYYVDLVIIDWRNWKTKLTRDVIIVAIAITIVVANISLKKTFVS